MNRKFRAALLTAGLLLAGMPGAADAASVHVAAEGDTFWKLSKAYGVPLDKLMAANPNVDPLNIYKGLKLVIPDAGAAEAANGAGSGAKATDSSGAVTASSGSSGTAAAASGSAGSTATAFAAGQGGAAPKSYKAVIRMTATAYTAAAEENGQWGPVDYFGNPLTLGTVAVDPGVIPLGSKLFITGYHYDGLPQGGMYAVASDIGGAIKGERIDIFVPDSRTKALQFGMQQVTVYIL